MLGVSLEASRHAAILERPDLLNVPNSSKRFQSSAHAISFLFRDRHRDGALPNSSTRGRAKLQKPNAGWIFERSVEAASRQNAALDLKQADVGEIGT